MKAGNPSPPSSGRVPAPNRPLNAAVMTLWPTGRVIFRVHRTGKDPREFNPGFGNPTRFAFFTNKSGNVVPSWYGGETLDVAIAESLFHDLPLGPGAVLPATGYANRSHSTVAPRRSLTLVSLVDDGLRALGLRASQITDTDAIDYDDTVAWAEAIHRDIPRADGLVWMSRQFNSARAISLFGDRVKPTDMDIDVLEPSTPFERGKGLGQLLICADRAQVLVEPPARPFLT